MKKKRYSIVKVRLHGCLTPIHVVLPMAKDGSLANVNEPAYLKQGNEWGYVPLVVQFPRQTAEGDAAFLTR